MIGIVTNMISLIAHPAATETSLRPLTIHSIICGWLQKLTIDIHSSPCSTSALFDTTALLISQNAHKHPILWPHRISLDHFSYNDILKISQLLKHISNFQELCTFYKSLRAAERGGSRFIASH